VPYVVVQWPNSVAERIPGLDAYDRTQVVNSHELAEAVTNPQVKYNDAWFSDAWIAKYPDRPGEVADIVPAQYDPHFTPEGSLPYYGSLDAREVQYLWANNYHYAGTNVTVTDNIALPAHPGGFSILGASFLGLYVPLVPAGSPSGGGISP